MTTALVVNDNNNVNQDLITSISRQYSNWDTISVDKYEDAIEKIRTGFTLIL